MPAFCSITYFGPSESLDAYSFSYPPLSLHSCYSKIAEAEAAVSVNEKKWLVMHMHVQLKLDELRGPQTLGSL